MTSPLRLIAPLELTAKAGDGRTVQIVAYSGGRMRVSGFGPLVIDLRGLEMPERISLLANHSEELSNIIGHGTPSAANGQLAVRGRIADTPAGEHVLQLLKVGTPLQASVGVDVTDSERVREGDSIHVNGRTVRADRPGLLLVRRGVLREISIVPYGADNATTVSLAAGKKGTSPMNDETPTVLPADDPHEAEVRQLRQELRTQLVARYCHENPGRAMDLQAIGARAHEENWDGNRTELELLRAARPVLPPVIAKPGRSHLSADHLAAALMVKAGFSKAAEQAFGERAMEQSRPLHAKSLAELCGVALQIDGRDCPHGRDAMIRASISTGSMPTALGSSANKIMVAAYMQAPSAWRTFAAVRSAADFKTHSGIRPSFAGDLKELPPSGEVEHGDYSEEVYDWKVDTFAKQFQIDRRDWINDDASVFSDMLPSLARAAARGLNNLVAKTILANDAGTFWTLARANYQEGGGTALSAASLADAIELLRKMKDADGSLLDLQPAVLLVPPDLEITARELLQSAEMLRSGADRLPTGNIYQGLAQLAIEPRLSDSSFSGFSATAWYLFSEPSNAAVIVGFLDGQQAPTLETFGLSSDINRLAFGFRCFHDFGVALADFRAAIKSKGAG